MKKYQVIYAIDAESIGWQGFICHAEDAEHAEEQCKNAYPECSVLWVSEMTGPDFDWEAMEH